MREAKCPQYLQDASPDCGCRIVGGEQQSPAACSSWHPPMPPGPRSALGNSCSAQWGQAWLVTFCGAQRTRNRRSVRGIWAILGGQVQG